MGGRDFPRHEKKKPKKGDRKKSWPALSTEAERVEVVHPKGGKGGEQAG